MGGRRGNKGGAFGSGGGGRGAGGAAGPSAGSSAAGSSAGSGPQMSELSGALPVIEGLPPPVVGGTAEAASLRSHPELPYSQLSIIALPKRPGLGTSGKKIPLFANHFRFTADPPPRVLRYQVDVHAPIRPAAAPAKPTRPSRGALQEGEEEKDDGAKPPTDVCRAVLSKLATQLKWGDGWAYDGGHILYGARDLLPSTVTGNELVAEIPLPDARRPGSTETFRLSVRALGTFELAKALIEFAKTPGAALPWDALASLDTVLRHRRSLDASWVVLLSGNFLSSNAVSQLGNSGLEMWQGYTASTRLGSDARAPGRASLSLVVDMAAAAFVSAQPAPEYVMRCANARDFRSPLAPGMVRAASKAIKGLKVELRIKDASGVEKKRQYRAKGLTLNPVNACIFDNEALGKKESVCAYFERENKVRLQLPHWPCLDVSKDRARPCWLPLEFCHILSGQRRLLVEDSVASSAMIKMTAKRPGDRKAGIERSMADSVCRDPTMTAFGLHVSPQMTALEGRVLACPTIEYGGNKTMAVPERRGAWNLSNTRLYKPGKAPRAWGLICLDDSHLQLATQTFLPSFISLLKSTAGIDLGAIRPVLGSGKPRETIEDTVTRVANDIARSAAAKEGRNFCIVVLPDAAAEQYGRVKNVLDSTLGFTSQCMLAKHLGGAVFGGAAGRGGVRGSGRDGGRGGGRDSGGRGGGGPSGPDAMYIGNLILKVNSKLGGVNCQLKVERSPLNGQNVHIVGLGEVPTMLFGADVTHPAPGSLVASISAVVGSLDATGGRYSARLGLQPSKQETISNMDTMCAELLRQFRSNTGKKPERLVFFRDGVSEGQFQIILRDELPLLRKAFESLGDGSYNPRVTFVIVQKRHHTRLFCQDERDGDRSGNCPPGTVVDTAVCHPHEFSFFLCSHAGIQGTSRPAHYHVLLDENNYTADVMQNMCFQLCHLYCRCTRSVSIVPPVYYAHLAAFRGRVLRAATEGSDTASSASGLSGFTSLDVHAVTKDEMFFV